MQQQTIAYLVVSKETNAPVDFTFANTSASASPFSFGSRLG